MSESGASRLRIGDVWVDVLDSRQALAAIERLVDSGRGGAVYTPNVDHVVKAARNPAFRQAYDGVSVSLADGMPLIWASRLLGCPLPERVAGSDMLEPLLQLSAKRQWRVYLLGGAPGVAEQAARLLADQMGIIVCGWDDARIAMDGSDPGDATIHRARAARPDVIFVALGPPKQELWIARARPHLGGAVSLGVGASLDFLVGKVGRAPRWMANAGLEWLYRLIQEPRRLWRRYLVEGPSFFKIVAGTLRIPRSERVLPATVQPMDARAANR